MDFEGLADYHTHSTYSDGSFMDWMVDAAAEAGLAGIGISDHCMLSDEPRFRNHRDVAGYNLDITYERRRQAIDALRERREIEIYDAVEMDYVSGEEDRIAAFLEEAAFDYAIGSVHHVAGGNVHFSTRFAEKSRAELADAVDGYFDTLERLIRSELFEIAAHPDIVERNEALRGVANEDHYRQIAAAFADSRTIPEINAGRVTADYGRLHPRDRFLDILIEYDIPMTVGTDAHRPDAIGDRLEHILSAFRDRGIEPVDPLER